MVPAYSAFDVVEIAAATGREIEETAEVYFDLADRLQIARLRDQIVALPRDDRWNTMARGALRDDLYAAHAALARDVLMVTGPGASRSSGWRNGWPRNEPAVQRATQTLTEIWQNDRFTVATLSVAVRAIRTLVAAGTLPRASGRGLPMRTRPPDRAVNGVIVRSDLPARVGFPAWQYRPGSRNLGTVIDPRPRGCRPQPGRDVARKPTVCARRRGDPGLWADQERAQAVTRRLSYLEGELARLDKLRRRLDDTRVMFELAEQRERRADPGRGGRASSPRCARRSTSWRSGRCCRASTTPARR